MKNELTNIDSKQYAKSIEEDVKYSLEIDPTNKYSMSEQQKEFLSNYIQFKNIQMAADLSRIDLDTAKAYFISYAGQQEIRRINKAMYQRQFATKLLSIDEIGGWLSSLLTDENVPLTDRLKSTDKLKVAQMIIDLNAYKQNVIENPDVLMHANIEEDIRNLSISSIRQLLDASKKTADKKDVDEALNLAGLSPEETAYLKTLPTKDLLELINDTKGDENK